MKIKRHKHVRRLLRFYKINYNLTAPYRILIDGTFAQEALKCKINLAEQLPKYFEATSPDTVKLYTTKCALNELKLLGAATYGAMKILEQYPLQECKHDSRMFVNTEKCFKKLIGEQNTDRYVIATQSDTLKEHVRTLSGTPLLIISHRTLNLEKPSQLSLKNADDQLKAKLEPKLFVSEQNSQKSKTARNDTTPIVQYKKRKAKGPNPLSCKKSKKPKKTTLKSKLNELKVIQQQKQKQQQQSTK